MRPVRLTIQAFGPYPERAVIDFRDAVEAGLFGIYGPTGSGKSTIFSAMTFALFGEPAKTEQKAPSLRSDHAGPGVPTEVEFVFDVAGRRYVVLRRPDQPRPKQRGDGETSSQHEAFLFDATGLSPDEITGERRGKIVAEKKVRDVDSAIADMLGYGVEQFRQIVLLPQGRFETFLSAKTKERLEILRDLFDVSLYETLMADLKEEAEAAERHVRDERELCARRLSAEGFESTDALVAGIGEAEAHHARLLEGETSARAAAEAAQRALGEAETVERLFVAAEDARNALAELLTRRDDMEALAERTARAERARSLCDVEGQVDETGREVGKAAGTLREAQEAARRTGEEAASAAEALEEETGRAGDVDELAPEDRNVRPVRRDPRKGQGEHRDAPGGGSGRARGHPRLRCRPGRVDEVAGDAPRKGRIREGGSSIGSEAEGNLGPHQQPDRVPRRSPGLREGRAGCPAGE